MADADQLRKDLFILFMLLEKYEENVEILETKISNLLKQFPIEELELAGYEVYEAYEEKIPWYKIPNFADRPVKKAHAVFTVKSGNTEVSVGYNKASNSISFSVNGGAIRFFNLSEDDKDIKFMALMKKLLKIK